jgi:predicted enzyme related to lactoylglutathione lyase
MSTAVTKKNAKKTTAKKTTTAPKAGLVKTTKATTTTKKSALPSKVAYTIVYVPDMAKGIEFYKSIGLKLANESPYWSEFDAGIKFALHITDEASSSCGESTCSTSHAFKAIETNICFGVDNAKATYEAFKAIGVTLTSEPKQVCEEGGYCFGFQDCFGNGLSCYGN